jgi:sugar transferase (PEP-CTERM system associated)
MFRSAYTRLPRHVMLIALFDASLVMGAVIVGLLLHTGSLDGLLPLAGAQGASLALGTLFINTANGLYVPTRRSGMARLVRTAVALVVAMGFTYGVFAMTPLASGTGSGMLLAAMFGVAAVVLRRAYVSHVTAVDAPARSRTMIFGSGEAARVVGRTLASADPNAEIVGFYAGPNERDPAVPIENLMPSDRSLLATAQERRVDEIVVALTERRAGSMPLRELLDCKLQGIKVYDINSHFEKRLGQIRIDYVNAGWLIFGDGFNQGFARTAVKRLFDLVCASVLLLLAAPVMLLAALLIKLDSPGPVIYRQDRVGLNGRTFAVVKFRSMRADAEKDGTPRWATAGDDRVTRIGRVLRVTRIDELPQLLSVLKGDMSLVGPRPERPFFVEQLTQQIPFFAVRHSVKPGVTGWAQVRYQYGSTVEDAQEKLQYDLYYVKNHTLLLDLQVLLETVHVVLTGKGAR